MPWTFSKKDASTQSHFNNWGWRCGGEGLYCNRIWDQYAQATPNLRPDPWLNLLSWHENHLSKTLVYLNKSFQTLVQPQQCALEACRIRGARKEGRGRVRSPEESALHSVGTGRYSPFYQWTEEWLRPTRIPSVPFILGRAARKWKRKPPEARAPRKS